MSDTDDEDFVTPKPSGTTYVDPAHSTAGRDRYGFKDSGGGPKLGFELPEGRDPQRIDRPFEEFAYDPDKPPEPTLDDGLDPSLGGNFIFSVGKKGSGKTTLHSHMLRLLLTTDEFQSTFVMSGGNTHEDVEIRNLEIKFQKVWAKNEFPERSAVGRFYQLLFDVRPIKPRLHPSMRFGFVEMSGEDLNELMDESTRLPELLPSIDRFLENPKNNIIFLFICQGSDPEDVDLLFSQFLQYLRRKFERAYHSTCSVAIVVTNPEIAKKTLAERFEEFRRTSQSNIREIHFIKAFLPQTYSHVRSWDSRARIATFSVGEVRRYRGTQTPYIHKPDFQDARGLFQWLYFRFTGKRIGKGFLARTMDFLKELESGE